MAEEKVTSIPEEIKEHLNFRDKDGRIFTLSPTTYKHIKRDHCIYDPHSFVKDTLLDPFAIIEDKKTKDRWLYHKEHSKKLFRVVVTCLTDRKVKTAFISDEVKGGKVIWLKKN